MTADNVFSFTYIEQQRTNSTLSLVCVCLYLYTQEAAHVLLFDGISLGTNCLKVRRPKDFKPLPGIGKSVSQLAYIVTQSVSLPFVYSN